MTTPKKQIEPFKIEKVTVKNIVTHVAVPIEVKDHKKTFKTQRSLDRELKSKHSREITPAHRKTPRIP